MSANPKLSISIKLSWLFLGIAAAGAVPLIIVMNHPRWTEPQPNGFGFAVPGSFLALVSIILVSVPGSLASLICGLYAIRDSSLAYLSIIPSLVFLIYCGYVYLYVRGFI